MKTRDWTSVVSFVATLFVFLLLIGPFLWSRWIGELPGAHGQ
jgi:hypothetical protein